MTTHRKLAAILSADAAGYSRLMADDETATLRSLNDARSLFRERIEAHGGRLIDTAGDSILAEFPSAVEAVDCTSEIQHELSKRNAQMAEHRRMQFRIGINLGDVIGQEDGTIYGDGVNIAARLQTLAESGGMCISGTAFDQVEGKLPLEFKFIGEQQVKNIAKPVRAYRVLLEPSSGRTRFAPATNRHFLMVGAAAVFAVLLAAGIVWKAQRPAAEVSAIPHGPPGSGKPRLAVLPLSNISPNPEDEYFADTAIALERYRLRHGQSPPDLAALVPRFLSAVPLDPMSAKPFRYQLNPDGSFLLYSVGEDGIDDGGKATSQSTTNSFNFWSGKDAVWPSAVR